jgi:hypothetical protein
MYLNGDEKNAGTRQELEDQLLRDIMKKYTVTAGESI